MGTGCFYCAFENGVKVLEWKGKLEKFHTVFQAELMGLKETIIKECRGNETTKISTDGLSSVTAVPDPQTLINLSETSSPFSYRIEIYW
ncbi:hypothetical protein AVEN_255733-1 [Araneus ventricosus]|uniref:RNase H type-1 domain-containing protein n=1 Tax=Araneus ventricosus TaxID=182803 RepID=A0A4Y2H9E9_ARAVE|nr:hypothetical protein AVEN_255733-1 [Araneus ventricosus]